ncbi:MAG: DNA gyrase subunit A [Dehalococcoidales bacterium]|nr:DNA gyrase subunit A [Dehalococcoidales bacterium]
MVLGKVNPVNIENEMRSSYLDYAMSVIVSRALPDVRDGLKPVQRRILYAMNDMGITHASSYKKSARIVGEVLGKYHPHGDVSVYDSMVRMAQDFSLRYMLVDGQGNFGSVDDDPPAAMRYTEARLTAIAEQMLADIDKNTVNFVPNFDSSLQEPSVLPSRLPNLLVNGSAGIAVGMATNIPPHNLGEICDAIVLLIDDPSVAIDILMQHVKGPDFPTAGIVVGTEGIKSAYATGRGRIVVRARTEIIEAGEGSRRQIIVTELPFQTNKASLVQRIAELAQEKRIAGISEVRDESDRHGMRVVIDLKREAQPQQVLNNLYKHTDMRSAFNVNMLALVDGQPRVISLKEALQYYIDFRREVVTRRTQFDLKGAQARAHILEGLKIAIDHIDEVIKTIRQADNADVARQDLMSKFNLSQLQAQAILDMQLRRLANLERNKIFDEYNEVLKTIAYLESLLADAKKMMKVIKDEVLELRKKYADERRTEITFEEESEFNVEDLIPHQRVVVTLSQRGFVKRVPSQLFAIQHRGGKGIVGMVTREDDAVRLLTVADTHDHLLFFTNRGKVFHLKCYEVPETGSRATKGTSVINLFPIAENERVMDIVTVTEYKPEVFLLMATNRGEIKKSSLDHFAKVRSNGLIAMDVEEGDDLVAIRVAKNEDEIILVTEKGQSIRFTVSSLPARSRTAGGVRGVRLIEGDRLMSMGVADPEGFVLIVSVNGYGKLTPIPQYRSQRRSGRGVMTFQITTKTGDVAAARVVSLTQQVMIISSEGIIIRTPVKEKDPHQGIAVRKRIAQGVRLMRLDPGDKVVAITAFD